jgi:sterol desaturase/sphingolipid hydroxylase (fatty acid hydroxylase superfamily)
MDSLSEHIIRVLIFAALALSFLILEIIIPRRSNILISRKFDNFLIHLLNIIFTRFFFPMAATGIAVWASANGWGLFNQFQINPITENILSVVILDFFIYWQHVIFHKVPIFWKLHQVHHSDIDFDFTTALRFHPIEIFLSLGFKAIIILILGPSAKSVLIFEIILNSLAMFNHSNFKLNLKLDRALRWIFVTPDMHRIHHSVLPDEHNSNYGFNLSCWDRLFSSYKQNPNQAHEQMKIGLVKYSELDQVTLWKIIVMPFKR